MIINEIDHTDGVSKSHVERTDEILKYIEQRNKNLPDTEQPRVFYKNVMSHETGDEEICALVDLNPRARVPIRHLVMSWPEGEIPTEAELEGAVDLFLATLGLEGCLAKCGLHRDTDNVHLHVALCMVNPETLKMMELHFLIEKIHQAIALIEHRYGFKPEMNTRYAVLETGELVRNLPNCERELIRRTAMNTKVKQAEVHSGAQSATTMAKSAMSGLIKAIKTGRIMTWPAFHSALAEKGMSYQKEGSGALVGVQFKGQDTPVFIKASEAHRDISFGKLSKIFGEFKAAEIPMTPIDKQPTRGVQATPGAKALFEQYLQEKNTDQVRKRDFKTLFSSLKLLLDIERDDLYQAQLKERRKKLPRLSSTEKSLLHACQAAEKATLKAAHEQQRKQFLIEHPMTGRFPNFDTWLRQHGQQKTAERIIDNQDLDLLLGDLSSQPEKRDIRHYTSEVIALKPPCVLYRRHPSGQCDFIDQGSRIRIKNRQPQSIRAALQLAVEKWPKGFTASGSSAFKDKLVQEAVRLNIADKILNPELQSRIDLEKKRWREAELEKQQLKPKDFDAFAAAVGCDRLALIAQKNPAKPFSKARLLTATDGAVPSEIDWRSLHRQTTPVVALPKTEALMHVIVPMSAASWSEMKQSGYKFATVVQVAEDSYQGVLNVPYPNLELDQREKKQLHALITQKFNPKIADGGEYLALPGLTPSAQGSAELIDWTDSTPCGKAQADLIKIYEEALKVQVESRLKKAEFLRERQKTFPEDKKVNALFDAHRLQVMTRFPRSDESAIDLMTCQRMLATGHPTLEIITALTRYHLNNLTVIQPVLKKLEDDFSRATIKRHETSGRAEEWKAFEQEICLSLETPGTKYVGVRLGKSG